MVVIFKNVCRNPIINHSAVFTFPTSFFSTHLNRFYPEKNISVISEWSFQIKLVHLTHNIVLADECHSIRMDNEICQFQKIEANLISIARILAKKPKGSQQCHSLNRGSSNNSSFQ